MVVLIMLIIPNDESRSISTRIITKPSCLNKMQVGLSDIVRIGILFAPCWIGKPNSFLSGTKWVVSQSPKADVVWKSICRCTGLGRASQTWILILNFEAFMAYHPTCRIPCEAGKTLPTQILGSRLVWPLAPPRFAASLPLHDHTSKIPVGP